MSVSRKDVDIFRPEVEKAVHRFLGFEEPSLVTAAVNCATKGYDRRKIKDKLGTILDESQASRFTDKLLDLVDEFRGSNRKGRKRKEDRDDVQESSSKKSRKYDDVSSLLPEPGTPSPGQLTADKIKEMMANAQLMIQERKAQLTASMPAVARMSAMSTVSGQMEEKAKRAADLQARIQAQLMNTGLAPPGSTNSQQQQQQGSKQTAVYQPNPVILDERGRTIDASTGETIEISHAMPTLKANIRAKRREQFKHSLQDRAPDDVAEAKFFDARVGNKVAVRNRRMFRFHEEGKFQQLGQRMRTKAQLEKLQDEIAQAAKKTGIASAAKLATIQPKKEIKVGEIPHVEWWDGVIMKATRYEELPELEDGMVSPESVEGVTHLVEHPTQMKPPTQTDKQFVVPIILTSKERKKLRRQSRNEAQKDMQEKIRLGLAPNLEPKVRMANLMRVLGTEAVQDPTKVEAHVRAQMAKRQRGHEEANAARKLTPEQRKEKKMNKLKEDTTQGVHVTLYRVKSLQNPSKKFKIEANCKQLFMTGFVVLCKDCNVVVVEGGPKQQKKFKRLMLHRLKFEDEPLNKDNDSGEKNRCDLVWEGRVKTPAFQDVIFKACPIEKMAREQFTKHGVEHYWDLAYSGAVIESANVV